MIRLRDDEFLYIVDYMKGNYGINLHNKKVLIECRMTRELENRGVKSFGDYIDLLSKDKTGELAGIMVNRLTTNYTYFLREPAHFEILSEKLLPEFFQTSSAGIYNIWCAGCATGEECYTLAMLLQDYADKWGSIPHIRIRATDICVEALEKAKKGTYAERELESLPMEWQKKYCHPIDAKKFEIDKKLKSNIVFSQENLMEPVKERGKYHLILCRNVMIYFDKSSREKLIRKLEESLRPGGYLFIGHAELLSKDETILKTVYPAIYRKETNT